MKRRNKLISIVLICAMMAGLMCSQAYARRSPGHDTPPVHDPDIRTRVPGSRNDYVEDDVKNVLYKEGGIVEFLTEKPSDGLKYRLIYTPYPMYSTIADLPTRAIVPWAFEDVTKVPVLSDYLPIVKPWAVKAEVKPEDCFIYDMFDLTYYRDYGTYLEKSNNFSDITISLPGYVLDRFICLLHYVNGKWIVEDSAEVYREFSQLHFTTYTLSPFAIVVHDDVVPVTEAAEAAGDGPVRSPQTGYSFFEEVFLQVKDKIREWFD